MVEQLVEDAMPVKQAEILILYSKNSNISD